MSCFKLKEGKDIKIVMSLNSKNVITGIFILLASHVFAQKEQINQLDENGKKHGVWKKYYKEPKQLRYKGQFEHGKEVGTFTFYKNNKKHKPVATKTYKPHNDTVFIKFFSDKGYLITKGYLIDKKNVGKWIYYRKNNKKQVMMTENYRDGKLDGVKNIYFSNGKLTEEINYKNGKKDGDHKIYGENGQLIQQYHYVDNVLQGYSKVYDAKGNVISEGKYKNGKRDGNWRFYTKGKLDSIQKYPLKKIIENIPQKKKH